MNYKTLQTTIVAMVYIPILIIFQLVWLLVAPISLITFYFVRIENRWGTEFVVRTENIKEWMDSFFSTTFFPLKLIVDFWKSIK
jgi:hypothetical protein